MNIDKTIESLESGFQNPTTALYKTLIEDKYMEQIQVRRRKSGQTHHQLWAISLGEMGQQPSVVFYGHTPAQAIKKALTWKGLPTSSRGPKSKAAPAGG